MRVCPYCLSTGFMAFWSSFFIDFWIIDGEFDEQSEFESSILATKIQITSDHRSSTGVKFYFRFLFD